jgi:hypothetical protein
MKFALVSILGFSAFYGFATQIGGASQGCYVLVNSTPGTVAIKFDYLNNIVPERGLLNVRLLPGSSLNMCFDSATGAQATITDKGVLWERNSDGVLPMGAYPSAAPAGKYTLVPSTRYPIAWHVPADMAVPRYGS